VYLPCQCGAASRFCFPGGITCAFGLLALDGGSSGQLLYVLIGPPRGCAGGSCERRNCSRRTQAPAMQHTASHCNTVTHCNTLTHTATHCNTHDAMECLSLHAATHTATHRISLQHSSTQCGILYLTATLQHTLQQTASHCNTAAQTTTHCISLQHRTTHRNTPQHTATLQHTRHKQRCIHIYKMK